MKKVSVIVPVYNGALYLKACLDSILATDYPDLQIVLVDDGSTDDTPEICDDYGKKDERITVIHQPNGGPVAARNAGLNIADGYYISFVDADDMIAPCFYTKMVAAIERENADIAACEYSKDADVVINYRGGEAANTTVETFEEQLAVLTSAPSIRSITYSGVYLWDKLYRADKITEFFQKECLMCEDLRFNYAYIKASDKMVILHERLYYYRIHDESIMGTFRKHRGAIENGIAHSSLWMFIAEDAKIGDITLAEYLHARAAYMAHGALWRVFCKKREKDHQEFVRSALLQIQQYCAPLCRDAQTYSIRIRCAVWCCAHAFWVWKTATRLSGLFAP